MLYQKPWATASFNLELSFFWHDPPSHHERGPYRRLLNPISTLHLRVIATPFTVLRRHLYCKFSFHRCRSPSALAWLVVTAPLGAPHVPLRAPSPRVPGSCLLTHLRPKPRDPRGCPATTSHSTKHLQCYIDPPDLRWFFSYQVVLVPSSILTLQVALNPSSSATTVQLPQRTLVVTTLLTITSRAVSLLSTVDCMIELEAVPP